MKYLKTGRYVAVLLFSVAFVVSFAYAEAGLPNPETYMPTPKQILDAKKMLDDQRSLVDKFYPSKILPPELWAKLSWDKKEMSDLWAEIVGFKAPDVVGKIAPEIKPGKYTYKDLEKYPGLKKLFTPQMLEYFIKPGGKPHAGNIPEFQIVPTRQYYMSLPVASATKENMGKARQDEQGYSISSSWEAGLPFPQPAGQFKAQQVLYNYFMKGSAYGMNYRAYALTYGFDKKLRIDYDGFSYMDSMKLSKRAILPPFGYYDKRAEKNEEEKTFFSIIFSPRDYRGTTFLQYYYESPERFTQAMLYVPSMRRIRKMSSSDTQDPVNGQDFIYDDMDGFAQKLTPHRYPYKYELVGEMREYLIPVIDGTEYIDSADGYSLKNVKMMRRPMYTVKLTQQDQNYVYGKRIIYIDAELFHSTQIFCYDQKGRMYRDLYTPLYFIEESGMLIPIGTHLMMRDYIDLHTTITLAYQVGAFWDRSHFSLKNMSRYGK